MLIKLDQYKAHHIVESVAQEQGINTDMDCLERELNFNSKSGEGGMTSFKLSDGISFLLLDGNLKEDMTIRMPADLKQPIIFSYVLQGDLLHTLNDGNLSYSLTALQSSITTNERETRQEFCVGAGVAQTIILVMIEREEYLKKVDCYIEQMPDKMKDIFNDVESKTTFLYEGLYSSNIGDTMNDIRNDINGDVVRSTFVEGKILELISFSIRQFRNDQMGNKRQVLLRQADVSKIKEAKIILEKKLFDPPTIKELSKMIGINQNKLKFGFKELYDSTIKSYVIDQRLELARILILADGKSMQEIAKEIGYSNYSHFSRIFKRKYGMLPKDYALHTTKSVHLSEDKLG